VNRVQKKGPSIYVEEEHLRPFGLSLNELVRTPLGITGSVIGVKYSSVESAAAFSGKSFLSCCPSAGVTRTWTAHCARMCD
jgi:hypothetical protein